MLTGERGGSVVECRTPEREVWGSRPTSAVLCPWARHFTPRKYWLITQEAMAPSRHDWKIVDWDVKPQHNQPTNVDHIGLRYDDIIFQYWLRWQPRSAYSLIQQSTIAFSSLVIGERWVYIIARHPSIVINIFKWHLLWSREAYSYQISHIASIGQGNE